MNIGSKRNLLLAVLIGAALSYGVNDLIMDDSGQSQQIHSMEETINNLQSALAQKAIELQNLRLLALRQNGQSKLTNAGTVTEICKQVSDSEQAIAATAPSSVLVLKNLETVSENDPRSFSEKLNELLSGNLTKEKTAIASKIIFDMARDRDGLPDYTLQSIYSNQTDPDLKRVIAQVLSQRGDNTLLDNQITEAQLQLKSKQPKDRQDALNNLAKTHNAKAADAIAPLLLDPDTNVKLDALFALRDTGNQTHIALVEKLLNDPDPSVSSLARDVMTDLRNLSSNARTTLSSSDIQAELPPMQNP